MTALLEALRKPRVVPGVHCYSTPGNLEVGNRMEPVYRDSMNEFYQGDAEKVMSVVLKPQSVHCIVTSPPYYGLRTYLPADDPDKYLEIGQEESPLDFVDRMVYLFRAAYRVLRNDGTLWLNLGDSMSKKSSTGVPRKGIVGIPWRVALALQDDGWILRDAIVWHKPSCMPSSVQDKTTPAHEYLFMLTKNPKYYYDQEAIKEPCSPKTFTVRTTPRKGDGVESKGEKLNKWIEEQGGRYYPLTRNARSVWTIASSPYKKAHFATFPPKLIERPIKAGTSEQGCCGECGAPLTRIVEKRTVYRHRPNAKTRRHAEGNGVNSTPNDKAGVETVTLAWAPTCRCGDGESMPWDRCVVLDPFLGSGTTAMVANRLGRKCIGIDLSGEYIRDHAISRIST